MSSWSERSLQLAQLKDLIHLYPGVQDALRDVKASAEPQIKQVAFKELKERIIVTRFVMDHLSSLSNNKGLVDGKLSLKSLKAFDPKAFDSPSAGANNKKSLWYRVKSLVVGEQSGHSMHETLHDQAGSVLKRSSDADFLASLDAISINEPLFQPLIIEAIELAHSFWESWIKKNGKALEARVHQAQLDFLKTQIALRLRTAQRQQFGGLCTEFIRSFNKGATSDNAYVFVQVRYTTILTLHNEVTFTLSGLRF